MRRWQYFTTIYPTTVYGSASSSTLAFCFTLKVWKWVCCFLFCTCIIIKMCCFFFKFKSSSLRVLLSVQHLNCRHVLLLIFYLNHNSNWGLLVLILHLNILLTCAVSIFSTSVKKLTYQYSFLFHTNIIKFNKLFSSRY